MNNNQIVKYSQEKIDFSLVKFQSIYIISALIYLFIIFEVDITVKNKELLKKVKKIWNLTFSIFSGIGLYILLSYDIQIIKEFGLISLIDHTDKIYDYRNQPRIILWCRIFLLSKILELFDTILLKMSGKNPIFLQWYHHVVTMLYGLYFSNNYNLTNTGLICATMNFFIHTFMYFYFFIHPMLPEKHFIKKYSFVITIFQALQMFIALFCYVFTHFKLGYDFDYFGFTMYSIYAILFCKLLNNKVSVKSKNNEIKEE